MIKVYRSSEATLLVEGNQVVSRAQFSFDALFQAENAVAFLRDAMREGTPVEAAACERDAWLPPLEHQEIWAAGVTYYRSKEARMEESEQSGGDVFYDLVYDAKRPELFFKATASRARGHGAGIRVREDSSWDVPEPELTLAINTRGQIFGYTIGNDVSSRSIEGENPLYLPQAKVYKGSCAVGPALCVSDPLPKETAIVLTILRNGKPAFEDRTDLTQIKRGLEELATFLFCENEFPEGCYLMTGTGIVPSAGFTLQTGDRVRIAIDGLGALENEVE